MRLVSRSDRHGGLEPWLALSLLALATLVAGRAAGAGGATGAVAAGSATVATLAVTEVGDEFKGAVRHLPAWNPGATPRFWPAPPTRAAAWTFLDRADSAVVYSIALPDSGAADGGRGIAPLEAAPVRSASAVSKRWARAFGHELMNGAAAGAECRCALVRDRGDTAAVVIPVVQIYAQRRVVTIAMLLRDRCAAMFFPQGRGPEVPIGADTGLLLGLLRQALPNEPALEDESPRAGIPSPGAVALDSLPALVTKVVLVYPAEANWSEIEGTVVIRARVDVAGEVERTELAWSIPGLDDAAMASVRRWRFRPAVAGGVAVPAWVAVPVRFSLRTAVEGSAPVAP